MLHGVLLLATPLFLRCIEYSMENYKKRLVQLISNIALEYRPYAAVVPYTPRKTEIPGYERALFKRCNPYEVGIDPKCITEMLGDLESDSHSNIHSLIIVKNGYVIAEAAREGFSPRLSHISHSMSKSITGILIMMLCDRKKLSLDSPAKNYLPKSIEYADGFENVTIRHLMTMSSGISFFEIGSVCSVEWIKDIAASELTFTPGEKFKYNSMNSYALMYIANEIILNEYGITAEKFLDRELFYPLGIRKYFWEKGPEGVLKGGWGLHMSIEAWARVGYMMMLGGKLGSHRFLSEDAVHSMTKTAMTAPEKTGDFNYGYHIWVSRTGSDYLFSGMFGQNVWIHPEKSLVIAFNSGNNEFFQKSSSLDIIRGTFLNIDTTRVTKNIIAERELHEKCRTFYSSRRWIVPPGEKRLFSILPLRKRKGVPEIFGSILGTFNLPDNNLGILPAFVRAMQNNYQGGIRSFTFTTSHDSVIITSVEGGEKITIRAGIHSYVQNEVSFSSEVYLVSAMIGTREADAGGVRYDIELIFNELPNTRRITVEPENKDTVLIKMTEIPDESFIDTLLQNDAGTDKMVELFEKNLGKSFVKGKLKEQFSPQIRAFRSGIKESEAALEKENEKTESKINSSRIIRSLVMRLTSENDTGGTESKISRRFSSFISKMLKGRNS